MELITPEIGLIVWMFLALLLLAAWVIALINILKREFKDSNDKLIRILLVIFVPFIGNLLYYIIGRTNKIKINQL
jgi:hypothetical protein